MNVFAAANIDPALIEAEQAATGVSSAGERYLAHIGAAIDAHNVQEVLPA